ncbi:MAG: alpha/beta hydrolase [Verrucomicrobiota bacterium]
MTACLMVVSRLAWIVVALVAVWAYLRWFEWRNLYYPSRTVETTPSTLGLDYEDVTFISEDGRVLRGWWIPHKQARGTVLHCSGNAGNIGDRVGLAADLHRLAVNVFLFDYRGYGESRGVPTERGTYADARAAYEVVRARYRDADDPPVILHGQSLGGGVAIQLALDKPVRALVIESAFPSTVDMALHVYPWLPVRAMCHFKYDSLSKVGSVRIPKVFAHSRDDEMIPYELGRKLYEAAAEPKQFCELEGLHNDTGWSTNPEYWKAVEQLVRRVFGEPGAGPGGGVQ